VMVAQLAVKPDLQRRARGLGLVGRENTCC
jgi:hypothetical protein